MITLKNIRQRHGYSGYDHLLDDGPLQVLVGQRFASLGVLRKRANTIQARSQDKRCGRPPISVEILHDDGTTGHFEV